MKESSLSHTGVLGMKWGRRKGKTATSSKKKEGPEKSMSEQELKSRISRLSLEKQYKDLTKRELSYGEKFVKDNLSNSARTVAGMATTGAMLLVGKLLIAKVKSRVGIGV